MIVKDAKEILEYILKAEKGELKKPVALAMHKVHHELFGEVVVLVPSGYNKSKITNIGATLCVTFDEMANLAKWYNQKNESLHQIVAFMRVFTGTLK